MGSTCGSSLALMDAGVPVKAHVAGIAMGLASDAATGRYRILTDLQDLEDGDGGMDFKITGTRAGITAIQMDTKTTGLTPQMVRETIAQAKDARSRVLDVMEKVIAAPRPELSPYAPRLVSFKINPDMIRNVIGPGGKTINEIIDKTGVTIDVENDGSVVICSPNAEALEKAVAWVKQLTREAKPGEIFTGTVTRLMDFGAFVEILPKQEGLVHISELAPERVASVRDVVSPGDTVTVKVIEIDSQGRINLSIRQAADPDAPPEPVNRPPPRERRGGYGGGNRGGGGFRGHRG
jgi:polyribonucleotide nucleotidyltransferase